MCLIGVSFLQNQSVSRSRKLKIYTCLICFISVCAIYGVYSVLHGSYGNKSNQPDGNDARDVIDPWYDTPEFIFYVRFTSGDRWEQEYREFLIRTMRLFLPPERAKVVAVLDDEKEADHDLGQMIANEWPFPKVCYRKPEDYSIYHNLGKVRMYLDMFYADECTKSLYIGFVDTDTFFSTFVTPDILFENHKPIIVAKVGPSAYPCWDIATEIFLGKKEALQCMSTFPVMVKTEHIIEMRKRLAVQHAKTFNTLFRDAPIEAGGSFCICQFSIMCNYLWYYHRSEYSWHIQFVPNSNLAAMELTKGMASKQYYKQEINASLTVPIPRPAIHIRYLLLNGIRFEQQEPPHEVIEGFIRESLCYAAGFDYCPLSCEMYQQNKIHKNLFLFEFHPWFWDSRCHSVQVKHYKKVKYLISYYFSRGMEVFGLKSLTQLCSLIEASEPYDA